MRLFFTAAFLFLSSLSAFAYGADLEDANCEIAIPRFHTELVNYRIQDDGLAPLIANGFLPYRVEYANNASDGLILYWSIAIEDGFFGKKISYSTAVHRKTSDKDLILFTDSGTAYGNFDMRILFDRFPNCRKF